MIFLAELLIALLILTGAGFALVGSYGLAKLPDLMMRLHGPTKATTLGVGGFLVASILYFLLIEGRFSIHELLITLFLFITAPVGAHMMAKAHLHRRREVAESLPRAAGGGGWATLEDEAPLPRPEAAGEGRRG
jgi:multicomponent K+:H+ antiporter subunit G